MQKSLSLDSGVFSIKQTKEIQGVIVPWEVVSYEADFATATEKGGVFDLSGYGIVEIKGKDAADYLNRMSTVNIKKLGVKECAHGAFLTGRGLVVALGILQRISEEAFHFWVSFGQTPRTLEHLEQFHFGEQLSISDKSNDFALFGIWSKKPTHADWNDSAMPELSYKKVPRQEASQFLKGQALDDQTLLGHHVFEYFRIEHHVPAVGVEIKGEEIILETGFDQAVARNKGCYPGQEVVERIFTYGSVNKKLLGVKLELPNDEKISLPYPITIGGKVAGQVVSYCLNPKAPRSASALAYIAKPYWDQVSVIRIT